MPRCGEDPACAARPVNRTYLTTWPLVVPPMANECDPMSLAVWHIIAMSTSSNSPSRISSCLPPMNSILPCSRRSSRLRDFDELLGRNRERHDLPVQFGQHLRRGEPHYCAQHHPRSGSGVRRRGPRWWRFRSEADARPTIRLSSSPMIATRGPVPAPPLRFPLRPGQRQVGAGTARRAWRTAPRPTRAVRYSLYPGSGCSRMSLDTAIRSSLCRSIAAHAACFSSSRVAIFFSIGVTNLSLSCASAAWQSRSRQQCASTAVSPILSIRCIQPQFNLQL